MGEPAYKDGHFPQEGLKNLKMRTSLKSLRLFLLVVLIIFIFGLFSVKIWDPDFWWHLKTGEYIYQTGGLPETDPFSFTSSSQNQTGPEPQRTKFILTQYWLAQLIFYWTYKAFGFEGIIYLRSLILTMLIVLVYRSIRRENIGFYLTLILLIPTVMIFTEFTGERPQLFSFLFAFLLIYLIEGFRKREAADSAETDGDLIDTHRDSVSINHKGSQSQRVQHHTLCV